MKNTNFLLSIIGGGDKVNIKGKNPNSSAKIITSNVRKSIKSNANATEKSEKQLDENIKKTEIKKEI